MQDLQILRIVNCNKCLKHDQNTLSNRFLKYYIDKIIIQMRKNQLSNRNQQTNPSSLAKQVETRRQTGEESSRKHFKSLTSHYSQTEIQKVKFAQQYAQLTKQFQKILSKNIKTKRKSNDRYQHMSGRIQNISLFNQQKDRARENLAHQTKINHNNNHRGGTSLEKIKAGVKNTKLDDLYNNRLHSQILETASKFLRNRREPQQSVITNQRNLNSSRLNMNLNSPSRKDSEGPQISTTPKSGDKQIFLHVEPRRSQKINVAFKNMPQVLAHFHNLYKIYQLLENYKSNYLQLIKCIRKYIMNYNKADITKLENLLKVKGDKEKLKIFLTFEKIVILGLLENMVRENEFIVENEIKALIETIFGVYSSIFTYILQEGNVEKNPYYQTLKIDQYMQSLELCYELLKNLQIHNRKDLQSTIEFVFKKIQGIFRTNTLFFSKVKSLLVSITKIQINSNGLLVLNFQNSININRFFYFLLCEYALWLNSTQNKEILKIHKNMLDFFLTCPSPHLPFSSPPDKLTLVLQLEGTLSMIKVISSENNKFLIKLRPFALELVKQLSRKMQIILMTTLLPQNLSIEYGKGRKSVLFKEEQQYKQLLKYVSSILYKHHYARYRGLLVKDISRLGRPLQRVILIDDINYPKKPQYNVNSNIGNIFYEQNRIPISTWKGNPKDEQLVYLKSLVLNIIQENGSDVRVVLGNLKANLRKYEQYSGVYDQQNGEIQEQPQNLSKQQLEEEKDSNEEPDEDQRFQMNQN